MSPRLPKGNVNNVFHMPPLTGDTWRSDRGVWEAIQSQGFVGMGGTGATFTEGAPWVALSNYSKKWDHLGKGYDTFTNISWTDICNYMKFDLFFNDIFVLGGQVMRQKRGVAIGGMCSAQSASIYCMQREHFWHQQQAGTGVPLNLNRTVAGRQRVTLSLHYRPYTFRDNMVGSHSGRSSNESVRLYFQRVLGVELQVEGEGRAWTNLEACMCLFDNQIHLYMKQKMQWDVPEYKRLLRFPDVSSPNVRSVLRSPAPALSRKALFYASDVLGAIENFHHIMYEFS